MSLGRADFIIRSGRAFLYPVYKGTYERDAGRRPWDRTRNASSRSRGRGISDAPSTISRRVRTSIAARLAFYGMSAGADAGVILTALEPRMKASVLQGTGIWGDETPENDALNYAPRVRMPTLMLNGRYDFETPLETAQRPLFDLLGTPAGHKRHVVLETGHAMPIDDAAREILPWFDRYLGPVRSPMTCVDSHSWRDQRSGREERWARPAGSS